MAWGALRRARGPSGLRTGSTGAGMPSLDSRGALGVRGLPSAGGMGAVAERDLRGPRWESEGCALAGCAPGTHPGRNEQRILVVVGPRLAPCMPPAPTD